MEITKIETVEITIVDKVREIEEKSGKPLELDLTEVSSLANKAKAITEPKTDEDFELVTEVRKGLAGYRKTTADYFMAARTDFNRMAKGVIQIQNEVLDTFVPEEDRMKAFEKKRKEEVILKERMEALPKRKERLDAIGGEVTLPEEHMGDLDDYLLDMEDADFEIMLVQVQGDKNEADRVALEEEKAKMEADAKAKEEELAAEKAKADEIEKARQEERDKADNERKVAEEALQLQKDKLEREAKEIDERRVKEAAEAEARRVDAIRREEAEKARIAQEEKDKVAAEAKKKAETEADEKYQAWLIEMECDQYTRGQFIIQSEDDGSINLYKLVGTYNAKD